MEEVLVRLRSDPKQLRNDAQLTLGDALSDELGTAVDVHSNRFSRTRHFDLFGMFQHDLGHPRPPIAGASYLDLGCGAVNPYGFGTMMCMLGATSCQSMDLETLEDHARALRGVARLIDAVLMDPPRVVRDYPITRDQILRNLTGIDVSALRRGEPSGLGGRLGYHQRSAYSTGLADASIDVITSNSFLEHVDDAGALLREMARVTKPGGFSVHAVDGTDHARYARPEIGPHEFLTDPTPGIIRGCNRIRPLEFPALFEQHGFRIQQTIVRDRHPVSDELRARFVPPWSTMAKDLLESTITTLVARRA
jgi:SAM-dependent methyltransferase